MLRYYLDSNIYRYLKDGSQYNPDLHLAMDIYEGKVLFLYSDAHLDDLSISPKEYVDIDLGIMSKYVQDNYLFFDVLKKQIKYYLATPTQAFYDREYPLKTDFSVEGLFNEIEKDDITGLGSILVAAMKEMWSIPIFNYKAINNQENLPEEARRLLDKQFPNPKDYMSIQDIYDNISPYGQLLFKDKNELDELRKLSIKYLNSDSITFKEWGMAFSKKLKETNTKQTFLELIDSMLTEDQKSDLYHKLTFSYSYLEIIGIGIDIERSGGKIKKNSYGSLNLDARHVYYASHCDYLVTNDKGMQVKAQIIYSLFGIKTKVLSLEDFIQNRFLAQTQEETFETLMNSLSHDMSSGLITPEATFNPLIQNLLTYNLSHAYFNYFNKLQQITFNNGEIIYVLYRSNHKSNTAFYMFREIELISKKLYGIFGCDDNRMNPYSIDETINHDEYFTIIRQWTLGRVIFKLGISNKKNGSSLCLTFEFLQEYN